MSTTVWHVTIPAIALVRAETAQEAERYVVDQLVQAGFTPYEGSDWMVFESEPVEESAIFRPNHRGWSR